MQIVFLGTGGSWPSPRRNVSAIAIKRGPEVILFDCGEGTQRQFMLSPLSFMQISRVFLTHFHGDHFLGLPGMVQSMSMNGRDERLEVFGPPGTVRLIDKLLSLGHFRSGFEVRASDLADDERVDCGEYAVTTFEAKHTVPAVSYCLEEAPRPGRFDLEAAKRLGIPQGPLYRRLQAGESVRAGGRTFTPEEVLGPPRRGRKVVYTGDTMPTPKLLSYARGADVLIHDATADSSLEEKANRYGHSTARQAAEVAREALVGTLVLTHVSPRYEDASVILADAKAVFDRAILAEDFLSIDVPLPD